VAPSAATHQIWFPLPGVGRLKKMRWSSGDHAGPRCAARSWSALWVSRVQLPLTSVTQNAARSV
jgi:hypothetical protein